MRPEQKRHRQGCNNSMIVWSKPASVYRAGHDTAQLAQLEGISKSSQERRRRKTGPRWSGAGATRTSKYFWVQAECDKWSLSANRLWRAAGEQGVCPNQ